MSMYFLADAMVNRLKCFFMAQSNLTEDALVGNNFVKVDSTEHFSTQALRRDLNECLIWDDTTIGKPSPAGGFIGADSNSIKGVSNDTIFFEKPLTRNFLLSNNPIVIRAPAGERVRAIVLGDIKVELKYPAIIVEPRSKSIEFTTLSGTTDTFNLDFIVYVKDDKTQDAVRSLLKITDTLEHVLMTNLHIAPSNSKFAFEVTSKAQVKSIDYGVIPKGNEFMKASRVSWEGDIYFWRSYFSAQNTSGLDSPQDFNTAAKLEGC